MTELSLSKEKMWETRISEYRASGQTARNWCNHNNISISALKYWITKSNRKSNNQETSSQPIFAKVSLSEEIQIPSASVTIHFEAIRIEINNTCSPVLLSSLISLLKSHV